MKKTHLSFSFVCSVWPTAQNQNWFFKNYIQKDAANHI